MVGRVAVGPWARVYCEGPGVWGGWGRVGPWEGGPLVPWSLLGPGRVPGLFVVFFVCLI